MGLLRELSIKRREWEREGHTPMIPALGRQMQEDCGESEASLDYSLGSRPSGLRMERDGSAVNSEHCSWRRPEFGSGDSQPL